MGVGADGAILPATFAEDIDYSFAASPAVQVAGVWLDVLRLAFLSPQESSRLLSRRLLSRRVLFYPPTGVFFTAHDELIADKPRAHTTNYSPPFLNRLGWGADPFGNIPVSRLKAGEAQARRVCVCCFVAFFGLVQSLTSDAMLLTHVTDLIVCCFWHTTVADLIVCCEQWTFKPEGKHVLYFFGTTLSKWFL